MLKAIIIDDVKKIRESVKDLLDNNCPQVIIVAEAENITDAFTKITLHQPDLLFLDIEMPDGTGFELLQKFKQIHFKIIFITAYEEYAIKAFKHSAIDYLLKPVDKDELIEAVQKANTAIRKENMELKLQALFSHLDKKNSDAQKIVLKTSDSIYSVAINDIIHCESEKNYTTFYLNDGQKIVVSTTLKEYEELLSPSGFFRVHQSHLINLHYFDRYLKSEGGTVVLKNKAIVPVSSRKKEELLKIIEKL